MFPILVVLGAILALFSGGRLYSSTVVVPTIYSEEVMQGMIDSSDPSSSQSQDNRAYNLLRESGVLRIDPDNLMDLPRRGGDYVTIPSEDEPADIGRVDIASGSALTPAERAARSDVAVVQWNKKVYQFQRSDTVRTGYDASQEYSRKLGGKIAKRVFVMLMNMAVAAIDAVDSPSTNYHTTNIYSATTPAYPTLEQLRVTRATLGDRAGQLTTAVMHSASFQRLLKDLVANYGQGSSLQDSSARTGLLGDLLGINTWIVTDLMPLTSSAYNILLLGPGALWTSFQHSPEIRTDQNILLPSSMDYMSVEFAAVAHMRFLKWVTGSGTNPTDAAMNTDTNWSAAYDDHRRVLAAKLVCNS